MAPQLSCNENASVWLLRPACWGSGLVLASAKQSLAAAGYGEKRMSKFRSLAGLMLGACALAMVVPMAASWAQSHADGVPEHPMPLHAAMAPLTDAEIAARRGRGGGGGGGKTDYNISKRSDADKALPNPYAMNQVWYTMPEGRFLGGTSGIEIDRDGTSVWITERCGTPNACEGSHVDPVIHFSADGKILAMFGHDMINYPHGLHVDRDGNVWVTDTWSNLDRTAGGGRGPITDFSKAHPGGAQVYKFSPTGKVLLHLGVPGVFGNDETHFTQPSDVVTDSDGNIYVADGHDTQPSNDRIVKFDKTGKFIKAWRACQPWHERQIDCE